jgi:hypothetical protein
MGNGKASHKELCRKVHGQRHADRASQLHQEMPHAEERQAKSDAGASQRCIEQAAPFGTAEDRNDEAVKPPNPSPAGRQRKLITISGRGIHSIGA